MILTLLLAKDLGWPIPTFPCFFKEITGLPCAFCGGTRAACAILHGDSAKALYLNALAFPSIGLLIITIALFGVELVIGKPMADWSFITKKTAPFLPLLIIPLLAWWFFHITTALQKCKPELIDFQNPIAQMAVRLIS